MDRIQERRIIKKMVKQLSGFSNTEIFDVLYKTEQLFNTVKNPDAKTIDSVLYAWECPNDICNMDGIFYYLIDYTYNLRIYKPSHPTTLLSFFRNDYYFKTAYQNKAVKFTKKNILKAFKHSSMETVVLEFLKQYRLKKRDPKTRRLMILTHIEEIEHRIK